MEEIKATDTSARSLLRISASGESTYIFREKNASDRLYRVWVLSILF